MLDWIWSSMGRNTSLAISSTASLGVQCSPASSLFSSLNLRIRSSKMVPIAWLSSPGSLTVSSSLRTGFGLKFTVGVRNLSIRVSSAPPVERRGYLVTELELFEDVLDVGGEPVQVGAEVLSQLLLGSGCSQVSESELRGVEKLLSGSLLEWARLVGDVGGVEPLLRVEDLLLCGFKDGIQTADHGHRENNVPVFSSDEEVAEHGIRDVPDEVRDACELAVLHGDVPSSGLDSFYTVVLSRGVSPTPSRFYSYLIPLCFVSSTPRSLQ